MSKIEKLTDAQLAKLEEFRQEWLEIGLATGPADMEAVKPVIREFYKRVGKEPPQFVHCRSPLEANMYIQLLSSDEGRALLKKLAGLHKEAKRLGEKSLNLHRPQIWAIANRREDVFQQSLSANLLDITGMPPVGYAITAELRRRRVNIDFFLERNPASGRIHQRFIHEGLDHCWQSLGMLWSVLSRMDVRIALWNGIEKPAHWPLPSLGGMAKLGTLPDKRLSDKTYTTVLYPTVWSRLILSTGALSRLKVSQRDGMRSDDLHLGKPWGRPIGYPPSLTLDMRSKIFKLLGHKDEDYWMNFWYKDSNDEILAFIKNIEMRPVDLLCLMSHLPFTFNFYKMPSWLCTEVGDSLREAVELGGIFEARGKSLPWGLAFPLPAVIHHLRESLGLALGKSIKLEKQGLIEGKESTECHFCYVYADIPVSSNNPLWFTEFCRLRDNIWEAVGLGDFIADKIWRNRQGFAEVYAGYKERVLYQLYLDEVGDIGHAIMDTLSEISRHLRENWKPVTTSMWGSLDAYWIAYYKFPHDHLRPIYTEEQVTILEGWATLAKNSGWVFPYENICFVCDRPDEIHLDNNNRLHSDDGPSISFSDGWELYFVHGLAVPEEVIMAPETLTAQRILNERNVEVRRVMLDRFGQHRFLEDLGAEPVHVDGWGELYRTELTEDEPLVMVKVVNSTPEPDGSYKDYYLRVDPRLRPLLPGGGLGEPQEMTARNAVASTFGLTGEEYIPSAQS